MSQAAKIKRKPATLEQPLETDRSSVQGGVKSIGKGIIDSFWKDVLKTTATDTIPSQFALGEKSSGKNAKGHGGDLAPGQEFSLKKQEIKILHKQQHNETYFDDIKHLEKRAEAQTDRMVEQQVEQIRQEIKKLIAISKEMQIQFKDIASESTTKQTVKAGKYHITFFAWVLSMLQNARMKMQEGASWTQMFASKKKQKGYQSMSKKHGTSFSLSSERSTATQTG